MLCYVLFDDYFLYLTLFLFWINLKILLCGIEAHFVQGGALRKMTSKVDKEEVPSPQASKEDIARAMRLALEFATSVCTWIMDMY